MEQSVECEAADFPTPSGNDVVSGMSVITVESASPTSVHSVNSSADEMDDNYMVDVDEVVDSDENDVPDEELPFPDVVQCNNVSEAKPDEADSQDSSENFCISEIGGKEETNGTMQCETSSPENAESKSGSANDALPFSVAESSDKCDNGIQAASGNTTALESGII